MVRRNNRNQQKRWRQNSCAEILLKLIKKLQKENEELKRFTSDIFNENEYVYYKHKDGTISTCPEIEIK